MKRFPGCSLGWAVALVVAGGGLTTDPVAAADFSSWSKNVPIRFAGYNHGETLSNFPALVVLGPSISNFSYSTFLSLTNQDLRFTDVSQATELNYEIERWDTNVAI